MPEPLPPEPTSSIFESSDTAGNIYILAINIPELPSASIRAAYTPKIGNPYTLTYIPNGESAIISRGTVQSTNPITLKPTGSETTVTVTTEGEKMTAISGSITVGDKTIPAPTGKLTATEFKTGVKIELKARHWDDKDGASGENYVNDWHYKYSDFTKAPLNTGDKIIFRIRGTTSKQLKLFSMRISSRPEDWSDYLWYGNSDRIEIGESFDLLVVIPITESTSVPDKYTMYLEFTEDL